MISDWNCHVELLNKMIHLTQAQLTKKKGKQWLTDLQYWTSQGNVIASYREINIQENVKEELLISSNFEAIPISPSYETILEPQQTGENGLIENFGDYEIEYNFLIPGASGQDQITNVYAVYQNITIIGNSEHMPLTQINKIKEALGKIWLMFSYDDLRVKYLATVLNAKIPVSKSTWQVLLGPTDFFIPSGNWVQLSIANTNVVVFALGA